MKDTLIKNKAHAELSSVVSAFIMQAMRYDTDTLLSYVKRNELTLPLLAVLSLVEREGRLSIGELGASLDYSLANASLLVDKLVCQGCVTRAESVSDRRHKLVQLTAKGQAVLAELRAARADTIAQQLLLLPPDLLADTVRLFLAITDELPPPQVQPVADVVGVAVE